MSCITMVGTSEESERPAKRPFSSRSRLPRATPDVVARQAKLTLLAFQAHDARDEALAFLNGHRDDLGGRPIDVAGETVAGLTAAAALLPGRDQSG